MPSFRRRSRRNASAGTRRILLALGQAKRGCDAELRQVVNFLHTLIIALHSQGGKPPALLLSTLNRTMALCAEIMEMTTMDLIIDGDIWAGLVWEAEDINGTFCEHLDWQGHDLSARALEALLALNRVVESGEASNQVGDQIVTTGHFSTPPPPPQASTVNMGSHAPFQRKTSLAESDRSSRIRAAAATASQGTSSKIVFELTLDGKLFLRTNSIWSQYTGHDQMSLQGKPVAEILAGEDASKLAHGADLLKQDSSCYVAARLHAYQSGHHWLPEMEGKGMIVHDGETGTPSRIMWILQPLDSTDSRIHTCNETSRLRRHSFPSAFAQMVSQPPCTPLASGYQVSIAPTGRSSSPCHIGWPPLSLSGLIQALGIESEPSYSRPPSSLGAGLGDYPSVPYQWTYAMRSASPFASASESLNLSEYRARSPVIFPKQDPRHETSKSQTPTPTSPESNTPNITPSQFIFPGSRPTTPALTRTSRSNISNTTFPSTRTRTNTVSTRSPSAASIRSVKESLGWAIPRSFAVHLDGGLGSPTDDDEYVNDAVDLTDQVNYTDSVPFAGGGYSTVRRGEWMTTPGLASDQEPVKVVVKTLRATNAATEQKTLKHLLRELRIWQRLHHPNVALLCGYMWDQYGNGSITASLVSPYQRNGEVMDYLAKNSAVDRIDICCDVADGLLYLHEFDPIVVHGDLKGPNILVDDGGHAVISDFGLSSLMDLKSTGFTSSDIGGTTRFLAPELIEDDRPRTIHSDVYAFSCLCIQILHNQLPFAQFRTDGPILNAISRGQLPFELNVDESSADTPLPFCDPESPTPFYLAKLFEECWKCDPASRPVMREIVGRLFAPDTPRSTILAL